VLRRWLREIETLSDREEMVCICEPEVGENLSEGNNRSSRDIINYEGGRDEILYFHVGNEMRSIDLIEFQEGKGEITDFQVGKGDELRLYGTLRSSVVISYQRGVLKEEDQKSTMIIGRIRIFLPIVPEEASAQSLGVAEGGQPVMIVIKDEEKEKTLMSDLVEKEERTIELLT
jgi:hypothetical protein